METGDGSGSLPAPGSPARAIKGLLSKAGFLIKRL